MSAAIGDLHVLERLVKHANSMNAEGANSNDGMQKIDTRSKEKRGTKGVERLPTEDGGGGSSRAYNLAECEALDSAGLNSMHHAARAGTKRVCARASVSLCVGGSVRLYLSACVRACECMYAL